jgi:hypothetical protein
MVHFILLSIALVILSCFGDNVAGAERGAAGVASPGLSAPHLSLDRQRVFQLLHC